MLGSVRTDGAAGLTGPTEVEALDTLTSPTCAVTRTRTNAPLSAGKSSYVLPCVPSIAVHESFASQRSHVYVNVAASSLQLPGAAVSVAPTTTRPEIVG